MKKLLILILVILPLIGISQKTIIGVVTDNHGDLIVNAKVSVKNQPNITTTTNTEGRYSLQVPANSSILVFEKEGFETVSENINGRMKINVIMIPVEIIEIIDEEEEIMDISYDMMVFGSVAYSSKRKVKVAYPNGFVDDGGFSTEEYSNIIENEFKEVTREPLSTLSIDVDNASYSNMRRFLYSNQMPPNDAVRIEEMINYFDYDYPSPTGDEPFSVITEISDAPWNTEHKLIHVGIQGKKLDYNDLKPSNFVFLIDVSGSMSDANKLPLLKKSFKMLVRNLNKNDRVSLVVYASASGVVLPSTPASDTTTIFAAFDNLQAGGSTAGGAGIELAYNIAQKNLIQGGNNRVILATDGDFNVGTSSTGDLVDLITDFRTNYDIYLTICGFGIGNYKDGRMEEISNAGNGNYFYIDNENEAKKVFGKDLRANMFTIAKDVKIQIEFNPVEVKAYRLIGYENRLLANADFDDDTKDAGELGAGHTVTAIYEIIPADSDEEISQTDDLKYQHSGLTDFATNSNELMTLKLRYKPIHSDNSILIEKVIKNSNFVTLNNSSDNFRFSASVAAFGMLLRNSKFIENYTYENVIELAKNSFNSDDEYQTEFIELVKLAKHLTSSD